MFVITLLIKYNLVILLIVCYLEKKNLRVGYSEDFPKSISFYKGKIMSTTDKLKYDLNLLQTNSGY